VQGCPADSASLLLKLLLQHTIFEIVGKLKRGCRAIAGPATSDAFGICVYTHPAYKNIERINQIDHFIASRTTPQPLQQLSYPLVCNILGL
jgi:hypothetical protein